MAITVFFEDGVTQDQISDIGEKLRDHEGVAEVKFVSADEAWEEFRDEYFGENADLAEGFKEDNPLAGAITTKFTWRK